MKVKDKEEGSSPVENLERKASFFSAGLEDSAVKRSPTQRIAHYYLLLQNWTGQAGPPLTSAPDEKNRPSPVRTVKTVSGCSLSSLMADMVSTMSLPPNELSDFGRLNLIIPICPTTSKMMSLYLRDDMVCAGPVWLE
jgi:hypothetical protein